jgi:EAL domain-containing protein (putative c-di-GMP-specific phosphodiesterase class I)
VKTLPVNFLKIESAESAELLAARERIGADFAQGYQMARPRPLAELAP